MSDAIDPDSLDGSPARPRFCRRCGGPIEAEAISCLCSDQTPSIAPAAMAPSTTLRSVMGLYFSMLVVSLGGIIYATLEKGNVGARFDLAISGIFALAVLPWLIGQWKAVVPRLRFTGHPKWYALAIVAPLFTYTLASALVWVLVHILGVPAINTAEPYQIEGYAFGWLFLSTCIIPAFFEEAAFRGVIFDGLRAYLTAAETILVSAAVFAIIHLSIISLPHLLAIGLLLAVLRWKTGSLLPGMIAHLLHNLLVCVGDWWGIRYPW